MKLETLCGTCNSWRWCGRQCKSAPVVVHAEPVVHKVANAVVHKPKGEERYRDREARRAYRRDYMRKKRAKA